MKVLKLRRGDQLILGTQEEKDQLKELELLSKIPFKLRRKETDINNPIPPIKVGQ